MRWFFCFGSSSLLIFACSAPPGPTSKIIPLYFRGEATDDSRAFIYRSHPIGATQSHPVIVCIDQLGFDDWACRWMLEKGDRRVEIDPRTPVELSECASVSVELSYCGSLTLSPGELEACRPRLLLLVIQGYFKRRSRPNVIIILVDAMRPDHLPGRSYPFIIAPHLENMLGIGFDFRRWYGTSSSSRPSIGSIFTGLYPRAHGAIRHTTAAASLFPRVRTMAQVLSGAGYRTAAFHSNAQISSHYGFGRGFEIYEGPIWDPDVTRESLRWISRIHSPFFLYIHYIGLHAPYQPTQDFDELYRSRTRDSLHDQYCAEITLVDQRIGEFLLGLAQWRLLDNTLLWFLSDHGEEFLEHGGRYHGETLYEESIRTLSLLVYPPLAAPGSSTSVPGSHVDVLPTLCHLLNLKSETPIQGRDLSDQILGRATGNLERPVFAQAYGGEESDPLVSIRDAVVRSPWKLIAPSWRRNIELYDLQNDPKESRNLFDSEKAVAEDLLSRLDQFTEASDMIAEQLGRAQALRREPVSLSPEELENLRSLGYIR